MPEKVTTAITSLAEGLRITGTDQSIQEIKICFGAIHFEAMLVKKMIHCLDNIKGLSAILPHLLHE
jgi:hypothetical protein